MGWISDFNRRNLRKRHAQGDKNATFLSVKTSSMKKGEGGRTFVRIPTSFLMLKRNFCRFA